MSKPPPDDELGLEQLVENEIQRRLKVNAAEVPATAIFKFYSDMARVRERREQHVEEEHRPFSLIDELPTLPPDRALVLARTEAARLEGELGELHEVIRGLEDSGGEGNVVSLGEQRGVAGQSVPDEGGGGGGAGQAEGARSAG